MSEFYRIVGYSDLAQKPRGSFCYTLLKPSEQIVMASVPSQEVLCAYVKSLGYTPGLPRIRIWAGIGRGTAVMDKCEPLYEAINDRYAP